MISAHDKGAALAIGKLRMTVAQLRAIVERQAATIADLAERLTALENEVGYPPKGQRSQ